MLAPLASLRSKVGSTESRPTLHGWFASLRLSRERRLVVRVYLPEPGTVTSTLWVAVFPLASSASTVIW